MSADLQRSAAAELAPDSESGLDPFSTLRDLKAWMEWRLQYGPIKHQQPDALHYPQNQHPNGYAGVIVPDWEMRQKLANVADCLAQGDRQGAAAGKAKGSA